MFTKTSIICFYGLKLETCRNGSEWLTRFDSFRRLQLSQYAAATFTLIKSQYPCMQHRNLIISQEKQSQLPSVMSKVFLTCQRTKISESRFSGTIVELGTGVDSKRWVVGTNVVVWVCYSKYEVPSFMEPENLSYHVVKKTVFLVLKVITIYAPISPSLWVFPSNFD